MLHTKFRFIWPSGFRGEDLKKLTNQKQELPVVAMFVNGSGQNVQSLDRTFYRCFLPSFSSFGWRVSEEKIKMWKVNGRRTPSDGKSSRCLWQGELKMYIHISINVSTNESSLCLFIFLLVSRTNKFSILWQYMYT
jgi:hypothetical protein